MWKHYARRCVEVVGGLAIGATLVVLFSGALNPPGSSLSSITANCTADEGFRVSSGYSALYIEYDLTAGAGTMEFRQILPNGINTHTVTGTSKTADALVVIPNPGGDYRCVETADGGTWSFRFWAVRDQ